jgi:hypothetical protein
MTDADAGGARDLPIPAPTPSTWRAPHARRGQDSFWHERASLLTPVAKAFSTDIGSQVASHRRAGAWRHGLHRGDRRGALHARRADRADLRGHQRHSGDRPRDAQAAAVGRRLRCRPIWTNWTRRNRPSSSASNDPAFGQAAERLAGGGGRTARGDRGAGGDVQGRRPARRRWPARRPICRLFGLAARAASISRNRRWPTPRMANGRRCAASSPRTSPARPPACAARWRPAPPACTKPANS